MPDFKLKVLQSVCYPDCYGVKHPPAMAVTFPWTNINWKIFVYFIGSFPNGYQVIRFNKQ